VANDAHNALKIIDFRFFLAARLCVNIALQIQGVVVGWQIYDLTKDPLSLGLVGLSEAFPAIGISLYAGHVADIIDRRLIALIAVFLLAVSCLFLAVASASSMNVGTLTIVIYCLIALCGLARGFYVPAIFGMMSDIIPRRLYGNAVAWNSTLWQASAVAGPCLGGFLYVSVSPAKTYLLSTIILLAAFLFFVFVKSRTVFAPKEEASVFHNIQEGVRFVFSNQIVLGAMALDLFAVLFGGAVALLPIFTSEVFHCGPHVLGILRAAPPLGAVITAVILTRKPLTTNSGKVLLYAVAGFGLCMILFGLSYNLYLSLALLVLSGIFDGISVWVRSTIFQLVTPKHMKGRVAAVNSMFIGSSNEIGEFESGVTAKLMGLIPSVVFGGCMTLLVVIITAIKAPNLRKLHVHTLYKEID
jgi:MFS family permease